MYPILEKLKIAKFGSIFKTGKKELLTNILKLKC